MSAARALSPARDVIESVSGAESFALSQPERGADFHALYSRYSSFRRRLRFRSADQASRADLFGLTSGMLMLVVNVRPTQTFETQLLGQGLLEFHFRLSGLLALAGRWGELDIRDPSLLLWYQPQGCDDVHEQLGVGGSPESWVSLYCDPVWLMRTAGPQARGVLETLVSSTAEPLSSPRFKVLPKLHPTSAILHDIVNNPYEHGLREIFARAKGCELLCSILDSLPPQMAETPTREVRLSARDRRALNDVREILEEKFASPPELGALARRVGLNTTKLCRGFKLLFGETIFDYARRRRLERADELLANSDLQVRQVALRVGYQHHSTFTAAFVRQFGRPPKQRRSRG